MEGLDITKVKEIIQRYPRKESSLIMILQDIHDCYNFLPCHALELVAQELELPMSKIFSVATFYKAFSLKPRGKNIVRVCLGTACHIRGGEQVVQELERQLNIKRGETTEDLGFTLETVNCLGACSMAPIMVINDKYHRNVTPGQAKEILKGEVNEN